MKKFTSVLLVLLILLSACFVTAGAYTNNISNGFRYYLLNGEAVITACLLETEVLYIPSELDGYPVVAISDGAFVDNTHIRKIYIPQGVASIGDYAFYNCSNLCEVTVADRNTTIGEKAFCFEPFYKDGEYWADTTVDEDKIVFYGYGGYSDLKRYANTYRYKYVDLGYDSGLCGDTDFDNEVTVKDATRIQKYLTGMISFIRNNMKLNADFNRDKLVDIRDVTAIQRYIAGLGYRIDKRRVYLAAPEIWTGSDVYLRCTSTGYINEVSYKAQYNDNTDLYYADIPAIMDCFYVGSDYEAEVYSNKITVPDEDSFYIKCTSYQNWGLWTQYEWEVVTFDNLFK